MKRILVTGGAGFIGSHLCEKLLEGGHEVLCVDNLFTGKKENILPLFDYAYFEFIRHDICFPLYVEVDEIYNLACPASPVYYQKDPVQTTKTSVHGSINMLGLAKRLKIRILQASTSEVYGDPTIHPQKEDYWGNVNPVGVRSCYSDDTEILTQRGWLFFNELQMTDTVATLDEYGRVHYVLPKEIICQLYKGRMMHFSNNKIDLLVTPNHNMLDERKKRKFIAADTNCGWQHKKCPIGGEWEEYDIKEHIEMPPAPRYAKVNIKSIALHHWLAFLGIYLAEGCISTDHRIILTHGNNSFKKNKILSVLKLLPWKLSDMEKHQITICSIQLEKALSPFGHKSIDKTIPRSILDLPPSKLRILFDYIMLDGDKNGKCFYTSSKHLADAVQEVAIKIGKGANITKYFHKSNPWSTREQFVVNLRPQIKLNYPEPTQAYYAGTVYCVNVPPFHTVMVRRNGKAVFCGNCYDEGKRCAETLFFDYHRQHGIEIRVARIFNTYGPRMQPNDGRVISNFILQALSNQDVTVYGNGTQTRSFCYISDMVDGLIKLMENPALTGPCNLGNPNEISILDLASKIIGLTNSHSNIIFNDLPSDDPLRRCPDISLAMQLLNWQPTVSLGTGLQETISSITGIYI